MTLDEFVSKANEVCSLYIKTEQRIGYGNYYRNIKKKELSPNCLLYKEWSSGGMTGGNCWGNEPYKMEGEREPSFKDLRNLLIEVCPNIGILQYEAIQEIIKEDSYEQREYYGNYTEYTIQYITLKDLYNKLIELKCINA